MPLEPTLRRPALPVALLLALVLAAGGGARASESDEALLRSLDESGPVDRTGLARLLFGTAATLDGGKSSVRLLQAAAGGRDPVSPSVRDMLAANYDGYEKATGRFKDAATRLLDEPAATARLYAALFAGHYACYRLDGFTSLVETYGASGKDLLSVISSIEGCELFRRAAFHPRVEGLIEEALAARGDSGEVEELREELRAMEELLRDLRKIDEEP